MAWTLDEMRFVEQNYGSLSAAAIGVYLGRTRASVKSRLFLIMTGSYWGQVNLAAMKR